MDCSLLRAGVGERRAGEDPVERVVVALADRVELVVVAAGAAERQPQEGAAGRLDRVFERQVPELERRRRIAPRQGQKPGGDDRLGVVVRDALAGQDVAGQLLADELVEGLSRLNESMM